MSILTEEEINEIADNCKSPCGGAWPHAFYEVAEAMILAKLAGMELPPCYALVGKEERVVTETFVMEGTHYKKVFTEEQMRQAYAQGAASQLSAEPVGFIAPHELKNLSQGYAAMVVMLAGAKRTQPLYTLKQPK